MSLQVNPAQPSYEEEFEGGSAEAERLLFENLARDIMSVQARIQERTGSHDVLRASHAKLLLGVRNANLYIIDKIPKKFRVGYVQPGQKYTATIRLSNASGACRPDYKPDLRGLAVRINVSDTEHHDLLAGNSPTSHARNARQFAAFAKAMAGSRVLILPRLLTSVGPSEMVRMIRNVLDARRRPVRSLALERYWSRGAILWGDAGPVRYFMRPRREAAHAPDPSKTNPDYLHKEIAARLRDDDIVFDLLLQPFVDAEKTPIEDSTVEWSEAISPPVHVATLTIPKQDLDEVSVRNEARMVDQIAFNPWNTTEDFRPLGNLNRARKKVYQASAAHRKGYRFHTRIPLHNVIIGKFFAALFKVLNRFMPWHRLGWQLSLMNLIVLRDELRTKNLIDTEEEEAPPQVCDVPQEVPEEVRTIRTYDGTYNDLSEPKMGAAGYTFGRNMVPNYQPNLFASPDPIVVSRQLMQRQAFIPARSLNLLAAAWIQFQVHDWVNHPRYNLGDPQHDVVIPMPSGTKWRSHINEPAKNEMRISGNKVCPRTKRRYPIFENIATPWWDGSEVYGLDEATARMLRNGARIQLDKSGYLPTGINGFTMTGFNESWWLGLSILHTLFAREHNLVCDALENEYPTWDDEQVYQTARLIISALIAKIHTVEWTPAILATRAIDEGLHANWHGAPKDWISQISIWLLDAHALKGIPETLPDHHTAPYSLTEEFVSVYRLHPLIPDDYQFFEYDTGQPKKTLEFEDIQGKDADRELRAIELNNAIYSFGIAHPGAITLHNYPESLRQFERQNGEIIDLSVVDIVRDRRRGVPRYNDFREAVHKPRIRRWEELSTDPATVRILRKLYSNIDEVDTMVGLHAEPPPEGFGFSDTAFRIFILMATRRLQSDRFLTIDFRPEIYSPLGMDWIEKNGMTSIILRHCPELAATIPRHRNAFAPWRPIAKV